MDPRPRARLTELLRSRREAAAPARPTDEALVRRVTTIAAALKLPPPRRSRERWTSPQDLRYTSDHEWARLEDAKVKVGLTDFAQDALGDIVFVQLPSVGDAVGRGRRARRGRVDQVGLAGLRARRRDRGRGERRRLSEQPERINTDPYGEGWLCVIEPSAPPSSTSCWTPPGTAR